ncbi:unnamed protein product [Boreogadus saida]
MNEFTVIQYVQFTFAQNMNEFMNAFRHNTMVENELGERNFGFDSLKYMNHDMEEKGIVGRECIPLEPCFPPPRQRVV